VGDIVRYKDAPTKKRLQSAIALAVVYWVLLVVAEAALPWSEGPDDHAPHTVAAAVVDEFAGVMDHPHLQDGSTDVAPDTFATAVLPRIAPILAAVGLAIAVVAGWLYGGHGVWAMMRGPPRALTSVVSGRQLLVRFCIARR
jgi:hypothetical protein